MQALIFANGEPNDGVMVQRALLQAPDACIVAADGGARVAAYFGCLPNVVIGDMDSLPPVMLHDLQASGASIIRHPRDKDATDLELALLWAAEHDYDTIRIIGGIGGRFDHMMANVYLLALPELSERDVELVAANQSIRLLRPGRHIIHGHVDDTISLIPLGGDVRGVTTEHLKYPLSDETLFFGPARGVSNVIQNEQAVVTLREGKLMCVHFIGQPD